MMHPAGCTCGTCCEQRRRGLLSGPIAAQRPEETPGTLEEEKDYWKRKAHGAIAALTRIVVVLRPELKDTEFDPVVTALTSVGALWLKYQTRGVEQTTYKGGGYEHIALFETRNPPAGEGWTLYRSIENEDYYNDGTTQDIYVWRRKLEHEQDPSPGNLAR
jgi:hypothetical protein